MFKDKNIYMNFVSFLLYILLFLLCWSVINQWIHANAFLIDREAFGLNNPHRTLFFTMSGRMKAILVIGIITIFWQTVMRSIIYPKNK